MPRFHTPLLHRIFISHGHSYYKHSPRFPPSLPPVASLFEALSKAALMNPDPPEAGENEGDDDLIYDQSAFAAAGGATDEQVGRGKGWSG